MANLHQISTCTGTFFFPGFNWQQNNSSYAVSVLPRIRPAAVLNAVVAVALAPTQLAASSSYNLIFLSSQQFAAAPNRRLSPFSFLALVLPGSFFSGLYACIYMK